MDELCVQLSCRPCRHTSVSNTGPSCIQVTNIKASNPDTMDTTPASNIAALCSQVEKRHRGTGKSS